MPIVEMYYSNTCSSTNTTSSDIIWMGGGGGNATISTTTATSDWYMTAGSGGGLSNAYYEQQMLSAQMQAQSLYYQDQMRAQAQLNQYYQDRQRQPTEEQRRAAQTERERIAAAHERAKQLLLTHLTPAQKETFEKNKWFVVEGGKSKQKYRIRTHAASINIEVMDDKKVKHKLCAHLSHGIPLEDHLLAQKIMLESAEEDFLKIANRHAA